MDDDWLVLVDRAITNARRRIEFRIREMVELSWDREVFAIRRHDSMSWPSLQGGLTAGPDLWLVRARVEPDCIWIVLTKRKSPWIKLDEMSDKDILRLSNPALTWYPNKPMHPLQALGRAAE